LDAFLVDNREINLPTLKRIDEIMGNNTDDKSVSSEVDRILISFYLSTDTLEKLDDVLFYARKQLPMNKRRKLTKSVLYEIGLQMVIEDYNKKGEESFLRKSLIKLIKV
jgi:hypothetical protein